MQVELHRELDQLLYTNLIDEHFLIFFFVQNLILTIAEL